MQVAVAGVEDVRAAQAVLLLHRRRSPQHLAEALARDRAVHAVVVGRDAARPRGMRSCGRTRSAAARPRSRDTASAVAPVARSTAFDALDLLGDFLRRAVGLAQQDRRGVEVVAGVHERLDRARGRLVHHLQAGRDDARGDDRRRPRRRPCSTSSNEAMTTCALRGFGSSFTVTSVTTSSMPSEPITSGEQVEPGRIERLAAEFDDLAVDGHAAHAQHVVHGEAVLQAVHAAGVLGDVAADGAGDLRRRVRRVVQAVGRGGLGDREVAHAGLHARGARVRVDARGCASTWPATAARPGRGGIAPPDSPVPAPRGDHRHVECRGRRAGCGRPAPRSPAAPPPSAAGGTATGRRTRRAACPPRARGCSDPAGRPAAPPRPRAGARSRRRPCLRAECARRASSAERCGGRSSRRRLHKSPLRHSGAAGSTVFTGGHESRVAAHFPARASRARVAASGAPARSCRLFLPG